MIEARIEIETETPHCSFEFGLNNRYSEVKVTANGRPARLRRDGNSTTVLLEESVRRATLVFELEGEMGNSAGEDRSVIAEESLFLLWSDLFYPVDFQEWSLLRTTLVLPARFKAIAPGRRIDVQRRGENAEWLFEATQPIRAASVFADSRWIEWERVVDGFKIQALLFPENARHADQIISSSADVLKYYAALHGAYPFDQFGFITLEGMDGRRAFPGFVGYSPGYLEKEMSETGYDAHETALLYWGYTSAGRGPGSFAWTEGLGDYVEFLYNESRGKPVPKIFEYFRGEYLKLPADQDRHYTKLGGAPQELIHGKYPWIMQALRTEIGDKAFRNGIRLLFDRYRWRTFTMAEFVATFEESGGRSLQGWQTAWLEYPPP